MKNSSNNNHHFYLLVLRESVRTSQLQIFPKNYFVLPPYVLPNWKKQNRQKCDKASPDSTIHPITGWSEVRFTKSSLGPKMLTIGAAKSNLVISTLGGVVDWQPTLSMMISHVMWLVMWLVLFWGTMKNTVEKSGAPKKTVRSMGF